MKNTTLIIGAAIGLLYIINKGKAIKHTEPYYTIYNESGLIVAKDVSGNIIYSGTVIQSVVNDAMTNSPNNSTILISNQIFEVKGIDGSIEIPSNKGLIIDGVIRQADNSAIRGVPIVCNSDFINGNTNITLLVNGYIDGNFQNQPFEADGQTTAYNSIFNAVQFVKVNGFSVPRVEVRNPTAWSFRIDKCSYGNIGTFIEHVGAITIPFGMYRDGLHLVDSNNINIDNIFGESGDDLFALTAQDTFISDITVNNIIGSTVHANGIRIGQTVNSITNNKTITVERIHIKNAEITARSRGILFCTSPTSIVRDVQINFKFRNHGLLSSLVDGIYIGLVDKGGAVPSSDGGTYSNLKLIGDICYPKKNGIYWASPTTVSDSVFDVNIYGVSDGYSNIVKGIENNNIYNITSNPC